MYIEKERICIYMYFSYFIFKVNHFSEYIPKAFLTGDDLILDAEVLLVDTKTSKPLPFGTLGVHKVQYFHYVNKFYKQTFTLWHPRCPQGAVLLLCKQILQYGSFFLFLYFSVSFKWSAQNILFSMNFIQEQWTNKKKTFPMNFMFLSKSKELSRELRF